MSEQLQVHRIVSKLRRAFDGQDGGVSTTRVEESGGAVGRARVSAMATKWAYQMGDPRWLGLLTQTMGLLEECPEEEKRRLMASLSVFLGAR